MTSKAKWTKEEMLQAFKDYNDGKGTFNQLAYKLGIVDSTFRDYYYRYQVHGEKVLDPTMKITYSDEFKYELSKSYVLGEYSARELSVMHNIAICSILGWVKVYYNKGVLPIKEKKGPRIMKKSSVKSTEEKLIASLKKELDKERKRREMVELELEILKKKRKLVKEALKKPYSQK